MKIPNPKLAGLVIIATIAMGWSTSAESAGGPETSRTMMSMSATAADKKAKQDLLSILQPTGKFSKGMFRAVRGIGMDTVPRGTNMRRLCAMDALTLWYGATVAKAEPMNEPRRPVGISAKHLYHAAGKVVAEDDRAAAVANVWSRDCRKLQSDKTVTWFEAQSDTEAAKAVNALLAAAEAIRSGRLKANNCDYGTGDKTCEDEILAGANVGRISGISADCDVTPGAECLSLDMDHGLRLKIGVLFEEGAIVPREVLSISAVTYVVVT